MNRYILSDKLFGLYRKLPWIRKQVNDYVEEKRKGFNKENSDITIISPNCLAAELYWILGLRFNSPTINTSMTRKDYLKFCKNIKSYLSKEPVFIEENGIIKAMIDDIEIRFLHATDLKRECSAWKRRIQRVNYDKLLFIFDDRGLTEEMLKEIKDFPYRKILLCGKDLPYSWCKKLRPDETGAVFLYNDKTSDGLWKFAKLWDFLPLINEKY